MGRKQALGNLTSTIRSLQGGFPNEPISPKEPGDLKIVDGRFVSIPRMCFANQTPKLPIVYRTVARFIRSFNPPEMGFYVDTNFLTGEEKPRELWDALLEKQIVITPLVWQELQEWLGWLAPRNRWMRDLLVQARLSRPRNIEFDPGAKWHTYHVAAHSYYVNLLAERKRTGSAIRDALFAQHGREPKHEELVRGIQKTGARHDWQLMRKGARDIDKANFLADEELVATAVIDAVVNNRETTILTTDTDVQEQFRKLMTLLDHQYQGMLFAERYAREPNSFVTKPLTRDTEELQYFFASDGVLVRKPTPPGRPFVEWLLPVETRTCPVFVLLFGGAGVDLRFSPLSYTAERDFIRLLEAKGKTAGLNTDKLDGQNCHVNAFVPGINDARMWVAIAKDRFGMKDDIMSYPRFDMADANFERGLPIP